MEFWNPTSGETAERTDWFKRLVAAASLAIVVTAVGIGTPDLIRRKQQEAEARHLKDEEHRAKAGERREKCARLLDAMNGRGGAVIPSDIPANELEARAAFCWTRFPELR